MLRSCNVVNLLDCVLRLNLNSKNCIKKNAEEIFYDY